MMLSNTATLIPNYAEHDDEYSPWVVLHEDPAQLDERVLRGLFHAARAAGAIGDDEMEDFCEYLEQQGYTVPTVCSALVVIPVDATADAGAEEAA